MKQPIHPKTLQPESFSIPKSWALAALLVLVVNLVAFSAHRAGLVHSGIPHGIIQGFVDSTQSKSDVWLIGNSTLADSVEPEVIREFLDGNVQKITLGSAVLGAQTLLAEHLLTRTEQTPKLVCFFITKDDLNKNGSRARVSRDYYKAIESPDWKDAVAASVPLHNYRASIRTQSKNKFFKLKSLFSRKKQAASKAPAAIKNLDGEWNTAYLAQLGENYELDLSGMDTLSSLVKTHPKISFILIIPPITGAPARWQLETHPDKSWPDTLDTIRQRAKTMNVQVLDLSTTYPPTTEFFKDVYHLKKTQMTPFSSLLGERIKETLNQSRNKPLSR